VARHDGAMLYKASCYDNYHAWLGQRYLVTIYIAKNGRHWFHDITCRRAWLSAGPALGSGSCAAVAPAITRWRSGVTARRRGDVLACAGAVAWVRPTCSAVKSAGSRAIGTGAAAGRRRCARSGVGGVAWRPPSPRAAVAAYWV
jgi:hypothetical protein